MRRKDGLTIRYPVSREHGIHPPTFRRVSKAESTGGKRGIIPSRNAGSCSAGPPFGADVWQESQVELSLGDLALGGVPLLISFYLHVRPQFGNAGDRKRMP